MDYVSEEIIKNLANIKSVIVCKVVNQFSSSLTSTGAS